MEDKIIFAVTEEDAQIMAAQIGVERLTDYQIERIRKYVDAGLDSWSDVLDAAIRGAASA